MPRVASLIINVFIPVQLRPLTGLRDHVLVAKTVVAAIGNTDEKAVTLRHLVEALEIGSPGIKARLVDATGIRSFVVIFVDGEDARTLRNERAGRETQLNSRITPTRSTSSSRMRTRCRSFLPLPGVEPTQRCRREVL